MTSIEKRVYKKLLEEIIKSAKYAMDCYKDIQSYDKEKEREKYENGIAQFNYRLGFIEGVLRVFEVVGFYDERLKEISKIFGDYVEKGD